MSKKPNLLFIMTDHQRADSLNMIQDGKEVTPNLNKLADSAVVFKRAYNSTPLCTPSRTALATGVYPIATGVIYNDWSGKTATDFKPIHQYLAENDYEVAHVGVDHIQVRPPLRARVPFSLWVDSADYNKYAQEKDLLIDDNKKFKRTITELQADIRKTVNYSNTVTAVWPHDVKDFKDCYFAQKGKEFINQEHSKPFALFLNLWAPHPPLKVPEPYASMFDPEKIDLPENVGKTGDMEPDNRREGIAAQLAKDISIKQWKKVWAAHLALVNLADKQIANIIQELKRKGEFENTIIVFTSDHGDHLGQHGMYQKNEMYEQAINVPLLINIPGGEHKVIDSCVSHLDILPTILELLNINIPAKIDGDSLAEFLKTENKPEPKAVFSQYSGNPAVGDIRRAIITQRFKYVYDGCGEKELYDLENDPLEMKNLAGDGDYKDLIEDLHSQLKKWAKEHNDWVQYK